MTITQDHAQFLLDVTRLVWRRWAGRYPTGIDRVCLAYLRHFAADAQAVVQHRYFRRILDKEASTALFQLLAEPPRHFRTELVRGILRFATGFDGAAKGRLYLNVGHTGLEDREFCEWVRNSGVRPVYFVHDLIPISNPEYCRAGERERHRSRMRTVLTSAAGIIGNSQATLNDLAEFGRDEALPCPASLPAWLGTKTFSSPQASNPPTERPTFVMIGTIEARKNHLMLLNIWARLVQALGAKAPRLVVIGQRGWECQPVFDLLDRSETLRGTVIELGNCDDDTLAVHLANARALLFPSLAEGYGLPLAEALQAGTPVIASDLPVFREIGQGVPELLDPLDGPAWEQAILSYTENGAARQSQLDKLAGYVSPTWDDHFAKVDRWLSAL